MKILITHVSGARMIAQGTDGLSKGSVDQGVGLGEAMTKFCPWGHSACQRSPRLETWIKGWFKNAKFLEPADWFVRGHDHKGGSFYKINFWQWTIQKGNYVWIPPPAAADAAVEEIRKARMKRQCSTHVIVIPKLFTHIWMKQWLKLCDLTFEIPAQHSY